MNGSRTFAVADRAVSSNLSLLHTDLQPAPVRGAGVLVSGIGEIFDAKVIVVALAEPWDLETNMSRSTDNDINTYIRDLMPERVRKALAKAKFNLHYGAEDPDEDIEETWDKNSKIVEDWLDENLDDYVVDDGGNVSTKRDFDRFVDQIYDEREKEALQEAVDQGIGDDEEDEDDADEAKLKYAKQEAQNYADGAHETATSYDSSDVRRIILGKDWP